MSASTRSRSMVRQGSGLPRRDLCAVALGLVLALGGVSSVPAQGSAASGAPLTLVVLGDSLSAGYNLPANAAFPAVLEKHLQERGRNVRVINAGVSGDTATGGLERVDWSVPDDADGVILELGANDMLRGVQPAVPRDALNRIILRLKERKIPVMLAGMRSAPNLGGAYAAQFETIYTDLAREHGLILYPFFLDGVAGQPELLLPDGLHPNPEGVKMMAQRITPDVERFINGLKR